MSASLHLTPFEHRHFLSLFQLVDRDLSGTITKLELSSLFRTLRIDVTSQEVDAMMAEADHNEDGEIDFNEFITIMSKKVAAVYTQQQVIQAFTALSGAGAEEGEGGRKGGGQKGMISVDVLEKALQMFGTDGMAFAAHHHLIPQHSLRRGRQGRYLHPHHQHNIIHTDRAERMEQDRRKQVSEMLDRLPVDAQGRFHFEEYVNQVMNDK